VAKLAKNFRRLMKDDRFKKKFSEKAKKPLREAEPEDDKKKDPKGPRCFECSVYGHIRADCRNLKKGKGKAYNVTLSDESEEDAPESDKFLAFVALYIEKEDSYYSEHSENEVELKEAYKTLYKEFEKLREGRKQQVNDLNSLHTEKSSLLSRYRSMMMFQALSRLIPSEDLLFAITAVSMGIYGLSAPS
jgi:superfamily II RNA helicase